MTNLNHARDAYHTTQTLQRENGHGTELHPTERPASLLAAFPESANLRVIGGLKTYTLVEAAELCKCDKETYRRLIHSGEAPGRKVGRAFVIEHEALARFLRGEYPALRQAAAKGDTPCQSTNRKTRRSGTSTSSIQAARELDALLERR
jgi:excisionase family DNA binding protein